jgi:hypothetical protein
VVDAGESFAPGQVYVALSRLTSLDGLVLRSPITPSSIRTDPRVAAFAENNPSNQIVEQQLERDQKVFISNTLLKAFDWTRLTEQLQVHDEWVDATLAQQDTARRFLQQLEQLLPEAEADGYERLQQRTEAAVGYFIRLLDDQLLSPITQHITKIRSQKKKKKYSQELVTLKMTITRKRQQLEDALQLINGLRKGISTTRLLTGLGNDRRSRSDPPPPTPSPGPEKGSSPRKGSSPGKGNSPEKGNTRRISLQLHREGIPIREIAARRNLAAGTIETHLASFIPTGEIDIKELVPEHKIAPILTVIREIGGSELGPMKSRLGDNYSFGEIRAVIHYSKQLPTPP